MEQRTMYAGSFCAWCGKGGPTLTNVDPNNTTNKPEEGGLILCNICVMPSFFTGKVNPLTGVYETRQPTDEEWIEIINNPVLTSTGAMMLLKNEGWI